MSLSRVSNNNSTHPTLENNAATNEESSFRLNTFIANFLAIYTEFILVHAALQENLSVVSCLQAA